MRAAPTHPGQCVHEWCTLEGRTTPGAWMTEACFHCGAKCDRGRDGKIATYDRNAGVNVEAFYRSIGGQP